MEKEDLGLPSDVQPTTEQTDQDARDQALLESLPPDIVDLVMTTPPTDEDVNREFRIMDAVNEKDIVGEDAKTLFAEARERTSKKLERAKSSLTREDANALWRFQQLTEEMNREDLLEMIGIEVPNRVTPDSFAVAELTRRFTIVAYGIIHEKLMADPKTDLELAERTVMEAMLRAIEKIRHVPSQQVFKDV